jgi:hypothetical protein
MADKNDPILKTATGEMKNPNGTLAHLAAALACDKWSFGHLLSYVKLDALGELAHVCNADQTTLPIQQTNYPTSGTCSLPISEDAVIRNDRQESDQNKI